MTDHRSPTTDHRSPITNHYLSRLSLSSFRSYASLTLELPSTPIVIAGPNGIGKTNLLEAVSLLAPGAGLRGATPAELARQGSGGAWAVAARLKGPHGETMIGTGRTPEMPPGRRTVRIDGKTNLAHATLTKHLSLLWLTPPMAHLFGEGAAARRKFLDRLTQSFDTLHAQRLNAYEKAMRERNRLLQERGGPQASAAWLEALEQRMAEEASGIAAARNETADRLNAQMHERKESPFPQAALELEGEMEDHLRRYPAVRAEEMLRTQLEAGRARDAAAARTLKGPHRSDLRVAYMPGGMPAGQCSTGEQKALLLAILLASARASAAWCGQPPVLLLDEVAAHLDPRRRTALFEEILALGCQAWMTGTDEDAFARLRGHAFFVSKEKLNYYKTEC